MCVRVSLGKGKRGGDLVEKRDRNSNYPQGEHTGMRLFIIIIMLFKYIHTYIHTYETPVRSSLVYAPAPGAWSEMAKEDSINMT